MKNHFFRKKAAQKKDGLVNITYMMKKIMSIIVIMAFLLSGITLMNNNERSASLEIPVANTGFKQTIQENEEKPLKTRTIANVTLDGIDSIISGNDDGTILTANSYDENGSLMPIQNFTWSETFDEAVLSDIYKNTARMIAYPRTVGQSGEIILEHIETGIEYVFQVTVTTGSPTSFEIIPLELYIFEMMGVITASVYDSYNNIVVDYRGTVRITAVDGEFEIEEGNVYNYTSQDQGVHTFLITPHTWGEKSITIRFTDDDLDIKKQINISVEAGPVTSLKILLDLDRMGWNGTPGDYKYYAGEPLYLKAIYLDEFDYPCSFFYWSLIISHDSLESNEFEPEPWQSQEGDVIFSEFYQIDRGTWTNNGNESIGNWNEYGNSEGQPLKFFETGPVTVTMRSKLNLSIEGNITIQVNPTYLDSVIAYPDENPTVVQVGETQNFHISGYDQYGNEAPIIEEEWSADSNINYIGGGTTMNGSGEFSAIEYFSGESRDGEIHVKTVGHLGAVNTLDIPVKVVNDYDLWIEEDEIEPGAVLKGEALELKANVHYNLPPSSLEDDILEILVVFSLVEENGDPIKDVNGNAVVLFETKVALTDLDDNPEGVRTVESIIPSETFSEYLNWDPDNLNNKNYLKVEIKNVVGGFDISVLERTGENNTAMTDFNAVTLPEEPDSEIEESQEGSDYCLFYFIIIIIVIILCIVGTIFTLIYIFKKRKNKKKASHSPTSDINDLSSNGTESPPTMAEPESGNEFNNFR